MNLSLSQKNNTILVVDDNGINRLLPGLILRPFGWEVYEVDGGNAAIEFLKTIEVSCVLLDITMPNISGRDVLKELRANYELRGLKIFAYTANAQLEDVEGFLAEGFDAVLIKPLTSRKLLDALKMV